MPAITRRAEPAFDGPGSLPWHVGADGRSRGGAVSRHGMTRTNGPRPGRGWRRHSDRTRVGR